MLSEMEPTKLAGTSVTHVTGAITHPHQQIIA